jgi:hypothetical protein
VTWTVLPEGTLWNLNDNNYQQLLGTPLPQFFMSGDGHRNPPFEWATGSGMLKTHFLELMLSNRLCAHVEQQPEEVTYDSVHPFLTPVAVNQRVFGWELEIYKSLNPIMKQCLEMAGALAIDKHQAINLGQEMLRVNAMMWKIRQSAAMTSLIDQANEFHEYYLRAENENESRDDEYRAFLLSYQNAAMQLRTDANLEIGANIQTKVDQLQGSTHLITCGDAHITENPLWHYIQLPPGTRGVVDPAHG